MNVSLARRRRQTNMFNVVTDHSTVAADDTNNDSGPTGSNDDLSSGHHGKDDRNIDLIHNDILARFFPEHDDRRKKFEQEVAHLIRTIRDYEEHEIVTTIGQRATVNPNKHFYISSYYNHLNVHYGIRIQHANLVSTSTLCDGCGMDLTVTNCDIDDSVCSHCATQHEIVQNKPTFIDKNSISGTRTLYIEKELYKTIQYVQGKIVGNETIKPEVYTKFIDYCKLHDIDIRTIRPLQAVSIFKAIDYTMYNHIYLFLNTLNGYPLLIITEDYEYLICRDNALYMQEFEKIKDGRTNSPSNYFKLLLFLKRHGFDVTCEDLKIPKMSRTINGLTEISREIFHRLGWEFPSI